MRGEVGGMEDNTRMYRRLLKDLSSCTFLFGFLKIWVLNNDSEIFYPF